MEIILLNKQRKEKYNILLSVQFYKDFERFLNHLFN